MTTGVGGTRSGGSGGAGEPVGPSGPGRGDAEGRWAEAIRRAQGGPPGPCVEQGLRRRRLVFVGAVVGILAGVATFVVVRWAGRPSGPRPTPQDGAASGDGLLTGLGLGAQVLGLGLLALYFVHLSRRPQGLGPAPALALDRTQRRALGRQFRGRDPVPPERLVVVQDHARRLLSVPRVDLLAAGMLCQGIGSVLLLRSPVMGFLSAVMVAAATTVVVLQRRSSQQARAVLAGSAGRTPPGRDAGTASS